MGGCFDGVGVGLGFAACLCCCLGGLCFEFSLLFLVDVDWCNITLRTRVCFRLGFYIFLAFWVNGVWVCVLGLQVLCLLLVCSGIWLPDFLILCCGCL